MGLGEELAGGLPEAADLRLGGGAQGRVGEEVEVRAALVRKVVEDVDRLLRRRPALRAGRAQRFGFVAGARARPGDRWTESSCGFGLSNASDRGRSLTSSHFQGTLIDKGQIMNTTSRQRPIQGQGACQIEANRALAARARFTGSTPSQLAESTAIGDQGGAGSTCLQPKTRSIQGLSAGPL